MKVRNQFGVILDIPDDPHFKSLLKSLNLTPVVENPAPTELQLTEEPEVGNVQEQTTLIPVFESLLNQVPDDITVAEEVAVFVKDLPGFEKFTETDAADFLLYRQEKTKE